MIKRHAGIFITDWTKKLKFYEHKWILGHPERMFGPDVISHILLSPAHWLYTKMDIPTVTSLIGLWSPIHETSKCLHHRHINFSSLTPFHWQLMTHWACSDRPIGVNKSHKQVTGTVNSGKSLLSPFFQRLLYNLTSFLKTLTKHLYSNTRGLTCLTDQHWKYASERFLLTDKTQWLLLQMNFALMSLNSGVVVLE